MNKSTLALHVNVINAFASSDKANTDAKLAEAAFHSHCAELLKAGVLPTHYEPYWKGGQESKGRNEKCTASRTDAEQIEWALIENHKNKDQILAYRALSQEDKDNMTNNELKELRKINGAPRNQRSKIYAKFLKYVNGLETAALKEQAKTDPEAAAKLDEKQDKERRTKDLAALATILKRAPDTLEDGQMIDAKAAFKTLMDIYNS